MTSLQAVTLQSVQPASTPSLRQRDRWQIFGIFSESAPCPTWWVLEYEALEVVVDNSRRGGVVPDLRSFGAGASSRSSLIANVGWTPDAGRSLFFDVGTTGRLCFFGQRCSFAVWAPANSERAVPGAPLLAADVVDVSQVSVWAYPTGTALGDRQGRLTLRVRTTDGEQPRVEVPPGVTGLQIFESVESGGAPPSNRWEWLDRDNARSGSIPLVSGASDRVYVPGPARALRPAAAVGAAALVYTLAFDLRW
jgi:hypothetical protein